MMTITMMTITTTMITITLITTAIITILQTSKQLQRPQSQLQVYQLPHARPLCSLRQQLVKIVKMVFKLSVSIFLNYYDIKLICISMYQLSDVKKE